ncbi:FadR/GntR family transcriptional regulator [Bacillus tianshenii]|nr:FadR/GntR family transcriptional regulator [Bacillus tianshenii]
MQYKRIKTRKIYEEVAEALVEMIKSAKLKPGDKLDSVQQLAENFQVGRSAIREALSALRAMGLVEMRQGEGTFVRQFDPEMLSLPIHAAVLMKKDDIQNLLEVRKILEVGAVEAAAERRTVEDLEAIKLALEEMGRASENEELGEKADLAFHMAIAKASHNELLTSLMNNVSEMMVTTMRETRRLWLYSKQATLERLHQEHHDIYHAIEAQDPKAAQQYMLNHLLKVEDVLMKYVKDVNTTV